MTPSTSPLQRCKYCREMSSVDIQTFHTATGRQFRVYCRNCGRQATRERSPRDAGQSWNSLHGEK